MEYLKKYWWILLIAIVTVFITIPIIINLLYSINAPYSWLSVNWSAADALLYFGTALGGMGTMFLGIITLIQTGRMKNTEIDKENANIQRPFFIIKEVSFEKNYKSTWKYEKSGFTSTLTKSGYIYIKILNVGDGVANNLTIKPWGLGRIPKTAIPSFCIAKDSAHSIPVNLRIDDTSKKRIYVDIIYQNMIGYAYSQKIECFIECECKKIDSFIDNEGNEVTDYEDEFTATVFNIYSQISLGMNKYDTKKGSYLI